MKNVHQRVLNHPVEAVRPWIELAWSGTDRDVFPRDYVRTWRKNPPGAGPGALVVGQTRIGHGPFSFTLTEWNGLSWRVALSGNAGWHGFDLEPEGDRTRIRHTLDTSLGLSFRLCVLPVHDWAVESLFDRLEAALATGHVPVRTARRMSPVARTLYQVMTLTRRLCAPRR